MNVEITRFPRGGLAPTGRVIEILGRPGEIGVDVEIIIRKHHLPHEFPEEVLAEARAAPQQVAGSGLRGRRDFRDLPIVTIDGETARDFDDAVYVADCPSGNYELQVHIADVAHYVAARIRRSIARRACAARRSISRIAPCPCCPRSFPTASARSIRKVDRLVMSVIMEMDATGKMIGAEFTPGVIRSAERMTYTNVNKVLEGDPEMTERYAPLVEQFPPHEGTRAAAQRAPQRARLDRFRSARAGDRIRRGRRA